MKKLLSLILVLTAFNFTYAQEKPGRMDIEKLMKEKIVQLKNGALLVRLQTKSTSIQALHDGGNTEQANMVESKQIAFNKEIIAAFRNEFKFCPVYFFSSQYSEKILGGDVNGVVFVNDSLQPDETIKLKQSEFLTAEFGPVDSDTAAYFDDKQFDRSGKNLEKEAVYYGGTNMGFDALKIMNKNFIQLKKPFPYYVRTYDSYPTSKKLTKAVKKMNVQLNDFYLESKGR